MFSRNVKKSHNRPNHIANALLSPKRKELKTIFGITTFFKKKKFIVTLRSFSKRESINLLNIGSEIWMEVRFGDGP